MLFNSIQFVVFFIVVIAVLFCLPKRVQWIWLLLSSLFFYGQWNINYLGLIIFTGSSSYLGGRIIHCSQSAMVKRLCMFLTVFSNFVVLFIFKYYNFFIQNLNTVVKSSNVEFKIGYFDILLPVGISF
jgi:D-alanyl-lipoteichoic acid acyltransferase DltB (MBOAT superfamily)